MSPRGNITWTRNVYNIDRDYYYRLYIIMKHSLSVQLFLLISALPST